jgi:protoporphyrinogen oxidase
MLSTLFDVLLQDSNQKKMITREMKRCNANKATAIDNDRTKQCDQLLVAAPHTLLK